MSTMPLLKAKLKENIRKEATSLPVALEAQVKTRTRQLALRAVNGDFNELDLANLDALGRITGQIKNTYIESVSAAKITSATMLTTTLTLAGTDASANKSRLTMTGDAMLQIDPADEGSVPTNMAGRGIFNTGSRYAGLWFFDNVNQRGIHMRSDGVSGGRNGRLTFISTRHPAALSSDTVAYANMILASEALAFTNFTNASGLSVRNSLSVIGPLRSTIGIETDGVLKVAAGIDAANIRASGQYNNTGVLASFGGGIELGGNLTMRGYRRINAAAYSAITSLANGAETVLSYPGGTDPLWVEVRWRTPGGAWSGATQRQSTVGVTLNGWTASGANVTNKSGVAVEVQAIFWA